MKHDILKVVCLEGRPDASVDAGDPYEISIQAIESCYVEHTNFDVVLKAVLGRISRNRRKSGNQRSVLVEGQSDAGKTTLMEKVDEAFPRTENARRIRIDNGSLATCDHVPVVSIVCPETPRRTDILRLILAAVDDPFWRKRKTEAELFEATILFFRALGTQALLVDEAQRPTERDGEIIQHSVATLFQQFHDQGVVVVLLGLGRARALLDRDTQVGNRWSTPLRINTYAWGDPAIVSGSADYNRVPQSIRASRANFKGFVIAIVSEVKLTWAKDIDFRTDEDAFLVFYATVGLAGTVKKLFLGAVDVARDLGVTQITWAILAEAFERECRSTSVHANGSNPFCGSFERTLPRELPDDGRKRVGKTVDALAEAIGGKNKKARGRMLAHATSRR